MGKHLYLDVQLKGGSMHDLKLMAKEGRPTFDEYFLLMAFIASLRSEDKFIKHGAIIVENISNHVLGTGYNATFRKSDKSEIELDNRDVRRPWMIHAEENAIMNCTKNPISLHGGATIYITGTPCVPCLQRIVNFGINRICMAERAGTITENKETEAHRNKILKQSKISIDTKPMDNEWLQFMAV